MEDNEIGKRIRQRRKELGLTQVQIRQETGISSGNLSDIENGNKLPSAPTLISLSSILQCSIDWLLSGNSLNNEIYAAHTIEERKLLQNFRLLPTYEQGEIIEIIDMKLRRLAETKEGGSAKSSRSTSTESMSNLAG